MEMEDWNCKVGLDNKIPRSHLAGLSTGMQFLWTITDGFMQQLLPLNVKEYLS